MYDDWVIYDPSPKKWYTVDHTKCIGMNFCEWHYHTWMQHFPASRAIVNLFDWKPTNYWNLGKLPNFWGHKNNIFQIFDWIVYFLIETSLKENLPQ